MLKFNKFFFGIDLTFEYAISVSDITLYANRKYIGKIEVTAINTRVDFNLKRLNNCIKSNRTPPIAMNRRYFRILSRLFIEFNVKCFL